jgi:hypothetical protein
MDDFQVNDIVKFKPRVTEAWNSVHFNSHDLYRIAAKTGSEVYPFKIETMNSTLTMSVHPSEIEHHETSVPDIFNTEEVYQEMLDGC